jgi:hypothetical protein
VSKFYVGQRVRKVANRRPEDRDARYKHYYPMPIGAAGLVVRPAQPAGEWIVRWDSDGREHGTAPYMIEPLDDSRDLTSWDTCAWRPKSIATPLAHYRGELAEARESVGQGVKS